VFDMKLVILDTMDNKLDTAPGEVWPQAVALCILCSMLDSPPLRSVVMCCWQYFCPGSEVHMLYSIGSPGSGSWMF
jgi:hypothetical protein